MAMSGRICTVARVDKPMSILIVDDVPEICDLITRFLTPYGHTIMRAANGLEASRHLRTQACDLLITDVLMPEFDGLELISELKRTDGTVRILAISGGGSTLQPNYCVSMAKAMGAHATLTKPFDRSQFMRGVAEALSDSEPVGALPA
jgi:CheY-like chemotaxis protein